MSLENIIKNKKKEIAKKKDFNNLKDINLFGMMSTLLSRFLTEMPIKKHFAIYKENLVYESYKTETHTKEGDLLINQRSKFTPKSFENLQELKTKPHIITTFHLGMYLTNANFLYANGIEFTALISSNSLSHNGNRFRDIMKNGQNFDLKFIDAEDKNSALTSIRELKSGKSLLIYIDGNLGAIEKKENLCEINFLDSKINVRKGVSFISYLTKIPIVNVFNYIEDNKDIVYHISNPIISNNKNEDALIMEKIWNEFSVFLKEYPEQWEVWRYLHKSLLDKSNKTADYLNNYNDIEVQNVIDNINKSFCFNLEEYALFITSEDTYVLDKKTLNSYFIVPKYEDLLRKSLFNEVKCDAKNVEIINHLFQKKLLKIIPAN